MTDYLLSLPLPHDLTTFSADVFTYQMLDFVSFRLAYRTADTAMNEDFGGFYDRIHSCMIPISIAIVYLLFALQLTSIANRTKSLQMVNMAEIPRPFREFIAAKFPNIYSWTNCTEIDDAHKTSWIIGPMTQVRPWAPVRIDSSELVSETQ